MFYRVPNGMAGKLFEGSLAQAWCKEIGQVAAIATGPDAGIR